MIDYQSKLAAHPAFLSACTDATQTVEALSLLAMARWLDECTYAALQSGAASVEVSPAQIEIAAGCGDSAAIILPMAGYQQDADSGRWFSHGQTGAEYLPVPEDALYIFLTRIREEI